MVCHRDGGNNQRGVAAPTEHSARIVTTIKRHRDGDRRQQADVGDAPDLRHRMSHAKTMQ